MTKEDQIMTFLTLNVFDPIINSTTASRGLKSGINLTITRMKQRNAAGMIQYFWSAVIGTERSTKFARRMQREGFTKFEDVLMEFREKFNDRWLRS